MKFAEDNLNEGYFITSYDTGKLMVNGKTITTSLVIAPDQLIMDWSISDISQLSTGHIEKICRLKPELVLIGTGRQQCFPDIAIYAELIQSGIGVDIMDTAAACRTYNILNSEGRRVVAGLIQINDLPQT